MDTGARPRETEPSDGSQMSAWRFVVWFGIVAMLADIVYEGARSITGPLLASLGATSLVVGVVTGVGESASLMLRLVSGPLTDRTGRFWAWTLAGYGLTVVSVPLLGLASVLWVASGLVIAERVGKAVRSPAKAAVGALAWGVALGVQESTLRATVADLVGPGRRATAYGIFGAVLGVSAAAGGALSGGLYEVSVRLLVAVTALGQVLALVVLAVTLRRARDLRRTASRGV
ncbi:hypothetical protein KRR39_09730 [Nocardioides panacis]|uniref:Major facilitator superfamily (MFS) profile domain-containing protein n=1 Tax=Nocardioides panacis TaxID=2849501 RepID=A0A975T1R0_9ACTN|nr:MFS transporter [Nocardioides panacis]QWZ09977.1 hypothetical protein KRR39_09730 [Nocardioides panacis]